MAGVRGRRADTGRPVRHRSRASWSPAIVRRSGARDFDALAAVNDREQLEALAEVLQKHALDVAMASYAGRGRFGQAMASPNAVAWLRYAQADGKEPLAGEPSLESAPVCGGDDRRDAEVLGLESR